MLHPSPPAPAKFKKVGPLATFLLCGLGLIAHFFGSLSLASAIECRRHRSLERKRRGSELRGLTDGKCGEETAEAISAPRCPPAPPAPGSAWRARGARRLKFLFLPRGSAQLEQPRGGLGSGSLVPPAPGTRTAALVAHTPQLHPPQPHSPSAGQGPSPHLLLSLSDTGQASLFSGPQFPHPCSIRGRLKPGHTRVFSPSRRAGSATDARAARAF